MIIRLAAFGFAAGIFPTSWLGEDLFEQRLVEAAATVLVRAAFYWNLWHAILGVCTLNFHAGRAGIRVDHDVHRIDARIILKLAQRYRGGGGFFEIRAAVRAGFCRIRR